MILQKGAYQIREFPGLLAITVSMLKDIYIYIYTKEKNLTLMIYTIQKLPKIYLKCKNMIIF